MIRRHAFKAQFEEIELRDDENGDENIKKFEGYASVFGEKIPSYREIVDKGAFKRTLKRNGGRVPIFYSHGWIDGQPPVGVGVDAMEDEKGLRVSGTLWVDTQLGHHTYIAMKRKGVRGLSIGFRPVKDEIDDDGWRHITEAELKEYSPTPFPANEKAKADRVRSAVSEMVPGLEHVDPKAFEELVAEMRAMSKKFDALLTGARNTDPGTTPSDDPGAPEEPASESIDPEDFHSMQSLMNELRASVRTED